MLNPKEFCNSLKKNEIDFFTGVPDSLLKDFCAYVSDNINPEKNIITANEGGAIALAAGHYLATGNPALVYMQNSGQGNALNPLTSLVDKEIYGIPMLLLIGWRGEPGTKDEPQHIKQGKITLSLLDVIGVQHEILPDNINAAEKSLDHALSFMKQKSSPYAFVVRKGTFENYSSDKQNNQPGRIYELSREDAIKAVVNSLWPKDIVVSTTGMASRELFEYRESLNQGHEKDFLTVGSMGHSSQIALGIALSKPNRNVYCIDGDGSLIMHMGSLGIIGQQKPKNFRHIVINNGAHDSVGGQPTAGFDIDIPGIAKSCGYNAVFTAKNKEELSSNLKNLISTEGPSLLEIKVSKGHRKDLGRPTTTPEENKKAFMKFLSQ